MDDLIVSGLRIDWNMLTDSYVSRIPSLRSIDELEFHKNVTFLVGENGSGKSTLLEGIAVACGLHEMSHGEGFLEILLSHTGKGLYLMDEPESALSTQRQLTLLEHMYRMANDGSQFIIATHSPILLGLPDAEILSFDENGVHPCDYEDTDSYQITRVFINHRESLLRHLLGNET